MKHFKILVGVFVTGTVLFMTSITASAIPVTWYLADVVFNDGGTASGSFIFDADVGSSLTLNVNGTGITAPEGDFLSFNVVSTAGTSAPGSSYFDPNPASPGNFAFFNMVPDDSLADFIGTPKIVADLLGPLTNLGGTVGINIAGFSGEGVCGSSTCGSTSFQRRFISGKVTTSEPVPEPATMLLFGAGAAALAGAGARRRKS